MKALTTLVLACFLMMGGLAACNDQGADSPEQAKVAHVASANRAPFHRTICKWADKISPRNLQTFRTRQEAIRAGHRPCKVCKP